MEVEDLLLLESFQLSYLPGFIPEHELAAVLWANPAIKRVWTKRCPDITDFIERVLKKFGPAANEEELTIYSDKVVWTIADLLVYNKYPEAYDSLEFHNWDFAEITSLVSLEQKLVVDGGAGTGKVALEAARAARHVFAVEPVSRLRQFIRGKAAQMNLNNVFVIDGFLHAIPLPDGYADVLITSHALGWRLKDELNEFERVVKKGGFIVHCPGTAEKASEEEQHKILISPAWRYQFSRNREVDGWKRKYWKKL
ncbi:MAG: class I SAM-dependent methyltransferase [bacterium]